MPELPEVEVTRQGVEPHLLNQQVAKLIIRTAKLRWPIPDTARNIIGQTISQVARRGKYLLLETEAGTTLIHLGMSGSLRLIAADLPPAKHDHVDLVLSNGKALRLNDPRRFGAWLWYELPIDSHPLLSKLAPEPLSTAFDAAYLSQALENKKKAIKLCLMDNHLVVGVGNIYANETLFACGIHPQLPANHLTSAQIELLVQEIKKVLQKAITQGGTTLKDFTNAEGKPGYFAQQLMVYGREGEPCVSCQHPLEGIQMAGRATVFCPHCQPLN